MSNLHVKPNTIEEQTLPERAAKQDGNGKREKEKLISYVCTVGVADTLLIVNWRN